MRYEDIKTGQVLTAKTYNQLATDKWRRDWDKAKEEGRNWACMPQLAFYGFYNPRTGEHRTTGFVRKTERGGHWFKTKKEAVNYREKSYL